MKPRPLKRNVTRLNLELRPELREKLESLASQTDATMSETIRRALAVFDLLLSESRAGAKIVIRHNGKEREVMFL